MLMFACYSFLDYSNESIKEFPITKTKQKGQKVHERKYLKAWQYENVYQEPKIELIKAFSKEHKMAYYNIYTFLFLFPHKTIPT